MAKLTTIARPYTKAVFNIALAEQNFATWAILLNQAAVVIQDQDFNRFMHDPRVSAEQTFSVLKDILQAIELDQKQINFLHLLASKHRLAALPDISLLFAEYVALYQRTIEVEVTSIYEINHDIQQKLSKALEIRLERKVLLQCSIDSTLIGGMVIRAGDFVIDGSLRSKLQRLYEVVKN